MFTGPVQAEWVPFSLQAANKLCEAHNNLRWFKLALIKENQNDDANNIQGILTELAELQSKINMIVEDQAKKVPSYNKH